MQIIRLLMAIKCNNKTHVYLQAAAYFFFFWYAGCSKEIDLQVLVNYGEHSYTQKLQAPFS